MAKLESIVAQQDRLIAELSAELFRQQRDAAGLRKRLAALERRMEEGSEEVAESERPPHY